MSNKIDREVMLGFVDEARGYLPRIFNGIERLQQQPADAEPLEEIHRLTHSIKGAAAMLGLHGLANIAHLLEEALEQIAAGQLPEAGESGGALDTTARQIELYLDQLADGPVDELPLITPVVVAFRRLRGLPEAGDRGEIERLFPQADRSAGSTSDVAAADRSAAGEALPSPPAPNRPFFDRGDGAPRGAQSTASGVSSTDPTLELAAPGPELLEAFREEAKDHLSAIAGDLRQLEKEPADGRALADLRRRVHTLKGAAAMVGFPRCAELSHRMEDLLDELHQSGSAPDPEKIHLLFRTNDALEDLTLGGNLDDAALSALYGRYDLLLGRTSEAAEAPVVGPSAAELGPLGQAAVLDLTATPDSAQGGPELVTAEAVGPVVRVPIARLDEVVRLVSELVVSSSTFERHFKQLGRDIGELRLSSGQLKRLSHRFETEYEVFALARSQQPQQAAGMVAGSKAALAGSTAAVAAAAATAPVLWHPSTSPGFDELELDRYTEMHRISRQLGESTNDLTSLESGLSHRLGDFEGYLNRVARLTGEIQDKLMHLRMVPLAQLSNRLHRTVRNTAHAQGKQVDLVIEGEDTALDKTVLEDLSDPLLHLLRNAVGHGIEPPSLRRALGKPEAGQIRLRAFHSGTQVILEIADDGGGLDDDKLRARALESGRLGEAEAAQASSDALHRLIFEAGFSTASEIDEISGRGVGLDVVQSVVQRLEGTVTARSTPGQGLTFTIRLPLTLAVIRAIMVRVQDHTYALPLAPIRQILRLEADDLELLGREAIVRVREEAYPAVRLSESLGLTAHDGPVERIPALILDLGERRIALLVDRIIEARDVVVKPLGSLLRQLPGVTGATLTGDGSVVLILNPQDLVPGENLSLPSPEPAITVKAPTERPLQVMAVDDSVSVRRVLSNLIRNQGWHAITARDGLEALETLQRLADLPQVILLDIEMPRMDGYELTLNLRANEAFRHVPIIMLTSRAGQKHRQRAFEVGATEYLVKPFQDDVLIHHIHRLSGRADGKAGGEVGDEGGRRG